VALLRWAFSAWISGSSLVGFLQSGVYCFKGLINLGFRRSGSAFKRRVEIESERERDRENNWK
jgi:hypothetical protein